MISWGGCPSNPTYLLYALMSGFLLALSVVFESAAEVANENAQFV